MPPEACAPANKHTVRLRKTGSGVPLVEYKDYDNTLGLAKSASDQDIKKAYRTLVRQHHPDVSRAHDGDPKTQDINEAYGVLGDAQKRAAYDALGGCRGAGGGRPFQAPPGWSANVNFDHAGSAGGAGDPYQDFFARLFAKSGGQGGQGRAGWRRRGGDLYASLWIDLAHTYHGARRLVTVRVPAPDQYGRMTTQEHTVSVDIALGVLAGQQLRLPGQGGRGNGGGEAGDVLLEIGFKPDPRYRLEVNVPGGSQSGRKLRLKGRGITERPPGDLYRVLDVVLPPATSDRAREFYRAMARAMPFNPRAVQPPRS